MRNRSLKRAKQEREYVKLRHEYLTDHPVCEAKWLCDGGMSTQIHHKKGRISGLLTDTAYFMAVCDRCHQKIELRPLEAKEKGFSLSRLIK